MAKNKKIEAAELGSNQFEFNGKKYNVLKGARVPLANGSELLTAADICVHTEAQAYLVESGASCIEEVTE
jgi:hypothetical protein